MTRWALVPVGPTDEMLNNVYQEVGGSCYVCSRWNASDDDSRRAFADLLEVSPGNALLSEILAMRDKILFAKKHSASAHNHECQLMILLNKLGPAS